jgi:hypothetical protein
MPHRRHRAVCYGASLALILSGMALLLTEQPPGLTWALVLCAIALAVAPWRDAGDRRWHYERGSADGHAADAHRPLTRRAK